MITDTPGITQNKRSSRYFVTRAWNTLIETDKCLVVVDCLKQIDNLLKETLRRLNKLKDDEDIKRVFRKAANGEDMGMDLDKYMKQYEHKENLQQMPKCLVLNKIDLCNNKRELRTLVSEIEDLAKFDKVFYTSCETGYGINDLKKYLEAECYNSPWQYHPEVKTSQSDADKFEEVMRAAIFQRFFHELPYTIGINLTGNY